MFDLVPRRLVQAGINLDFRISQQSCIISLYLIFINGREDMSIGIRVVIFSSSKDHTPALTLA